VKIYRTGGEEAWVLVHIVPKARCNQPPSNVTQFTQRFKQKVTGIKLSLRQSEIFSESLYIARSSRFGMAARCSLNTLGLDGTGRCLMVVAKGLTNAEIGMELWITQNR